MLLPPIPDRRPLSRAPSWLFACALLIACGGEPTPSPEAVAALQQQDLDAAEARARNGRWDDALPIYERILERDATNVAAIIGIGRSNFGKRNFDVAETHLKRAVSLAPNRADAHALLGELYSFREEYAKSSEAYGAAWALDRESSEFGLPYGRALHLEGRHAEAERVLKETADLDPKAKAPDGVGVHTLLADAIRAQDRLDDALRMYMKAQSTYGSDKKARAGAAFVYESKNDVKHALDEWSAYIQLDCCSDYSRTVAHKKLLELEARAKSGGSEDETHEAGGA